MPEITITMPTYCRAKSGFLARAIESVLNQTFKDFEFVIIDDGSTDGTKEITEEYARKDSRIRLIRFEENSGLPTKLTRQVIPTIKSKYISHIFDDDIWYPHMLDVLYREITRNRVDFVYGNMITHLRYNDKPYCIVQGEETDKFNRDLLITRVCYISNAAVLYKKKCYEKTGFSDPHLIIRNWCDWDLWIRMSKYYKFRHVNCLVGEEMGHILKDSIRSTTLDTPDTTLLNRMYMATRRDNYLQPDNIDLWDIEDLSILGNNIPPNIREQAYWKFVFFYLRKGNVAKCRKYLDALKNSKYADEVSDLLSNIDTIKPNSETVLKLIETTLPKLRRSWSFAEVVWLNLYKVKVAIFSLEDDIFSKIYRLIALLFNSIIWLLRKHNTIKPFRHGRVVHPTTKLH